MIKSNLQVRLSIVKQFSVKNVQSPILSKIMIYKFLGPKIKTIYKDISIYNI